MAVFARACGCALDTISFESVNGIYLLQGTRERLRVKRRGAGVHASPRTCEQDARAHLLGWGAVAPSPVDACCDTTPLTLYVHCIGAATGLGRTCAIP